MEVLVVKISVLKKVSAFFLGCSAVLCFLCVALLLIAAPIQSIPFLSKFSLQLTHGAFGLWVVQALGVCGALAIACALLGKFFSLLGCIISGQRKKMTSQEAEDTARRCIWSAAASCFAAIASGIAMPYLLERALFLSLLSRVSVAPVVVWAYFALGCAFAALIMLLCAAICSYISDVREEKIKAG